MDDVHVKYLTKCEIPVVAEGPTFKLFSDNALFIYNTLWHEFEFVEIISDELVERWKQSVSPTANWCLVCLD